MVLSMQTLLLKKRSETYPTAKTLVSLWSEYTGSAFYSILDRNNKIPIHTAILVIEIQKQ